MRLFPGRVIVVIVFDRVTCTTILVYDICCNLGRTPKGSEVRREKPNLCAPPPKHVALPDEFPTHTSVVLVVCPGCTSHYKPRWLQFRYLLSHSEIWDCKQFKLNRAFVRYLNFTGNIPRLKNIVRYTSYFVTKEFISWGFHFSRV